MATGYDRSGLGQKRVLNLGGTSTELYMIGLWVKRGLGTSPPTVVDVLVE